jgi:hypothetical protein
LATELAKDCGVGIEWLHPWSNATRMTSELLPMKTTAL